MHIREYYLEKRMDAEEILSTLRASGEMFGCVFLADYYEALDVESDYDDTMYGWTVDTIKLAYIESTRRGYTIKFPVMIKLENIGGR